MHLWTSSFSVWVHIHSKSQILRSSKAFKNEGFLHWSSHSISFILTHSTYTNHFHPQLRHESAPFIINLWQVPSKTSFASNMCLTGRTARQEIAPIIMSQLTMNPLSKTNPTPSFSPIQTDETGFISHGYAIWTCCECGDSGMNVRSTDKYAI